MLNLPNRIAIEAALNLPPGLTYKLLIERAAGTLPTLRAICSEYVDLGRG